MNDVAIGIHYLDLKRISNEQDGDRGEDERISNFLEWVLKSCSWDVKLGETEIQIQESLELGWFFFFMRFPFFSRVFTNIWSSLD